MENLGQGVAFFGPGQEGEVNVFSADGGGWIYFHASLANILSKCHKWAVFMKTIEFGYIKYYLGGDKMGGGLNLFTLN